MNNPENFDDGTTMVLSDLEICKCGHKKHWHFVRVDEKCDVYGCNCKKFKIAVSIGRKD